MGSFLQFVGIKPLKFLRLFVSLLIVALLGGLILYNVNVTTKYILNLSYEVESIQRIKLDSCSNDISSKCVNELLKDRPIRNFTAAMLVMVKTTGFFVKYGKKIKPEMSTQEHNAAINNILAAIDLKNNSLRQMKTFFGYGKKEICMLKVVEKDLALSFVERMSAKSAKDRQKTYEDYPANQELIHIFVRRQEIMDKLKVEIETYFPEKSLSKCRDQLRDTEKEELQKEKAKLKEVN